MILSTRSGGIGVNLTGADTVIFYDSDWNPAMDAQAQDRCHRIGQTREVNIYRLISEHTIEENILKKANQKRYLDKLVIENGSFTNQMFKPSNLRNLITGSEADEPAPENTTEQDWVKAMTQAEEAQDVAAMKNAQAEVNQELEDFAGDENVSQVSEENYMTPQGKRKSQIYQNQTQDQILMQNFESRMPDIVKYAVRFLSVDREPGFESNFLNGTETPNDSVSQSFTETSQLVYEV